MAYLEVGGRKVSRPASKKSFYRKKWFWVLGTVVLLILIVGGAMTWKTGSLLHKVTGGGLFSSVVRSLPGVPDQVDGEKEGRINVLLLGMRGENVAGGGTLADTIMIASLAPDENKVSMISLPRDLYVDNPVWGGKTKINAVYAAGEENGKKEGLAQMKKVVGEVTGLPIHYATSINFAGFKQLVDAIGGIEITLDKPFEESVQWNEPRACDGNVFTIPTGQYQNKIIKKHTITLPNGTRKEVKVKAPLYPLCTPDPKYIECGGNFKLPAGKQTLNGEIALCYARSRYGTSDFDRAKRQQIIIQLIRDKLLSVGTLSDFGKLNNIADSLGDNVRTDAEAWEGKRLYEIYTGMQSPQVYQRVLENSEEGLLYAPPQTKETGYILLPIGDNYDRIREMAGNIFSLPQQTDIKPK